MKVFCFECGVDIENKYYLKHCKRKNAGNFLCLPLFYSLPKLKNNNLKKDSKRKKLEVIVLK